MKKRARVFAAIWLLILAGFALSSCFGESTKNDATAETETPTAEAHEHVWDEGRRTVEPNCEHVGEIEYVCTVCGATRIDTIPKNHDWDEGTVLTSPTCKDVGSRLRTCKLCGEKATFDIPVTNNHKWDGATRIVTVPTESREGEIEYYCTVCGTTRTEPTTYAAYQTEVNAVKAKLSGFSESDFGGSGILADLGSTYAAPPVSPTAGQHPRVLFNENDIAGINRAIYNGQNVAAATAFRREVAGRTNGILPAASTHGSNGVHNFSGKTLSSIMSLALDYQLTGNEISGYQAIYAAKNYLKTIDVQSFKPDPERTMGNIMYAMACVYDWCHPLMSATDKRQIVAGVQHKCCESSHMEIGFPPSGQGAVAGHGCEFQLLRDYLAFSIAIYDEYPGWWTFVGGRFYAQYVPVRDEFYKAGMVPQGASQYVQIRFAADCYSALLIKAMTGSIPYDEAGMRQVIRTVYSHELPNASFASGDGSSATKKLMDYGMAAMISSHLFGDATIRALYENNKNSYSVFGDGQYGDDQVIGYAPEELICSSTGVTAAKTLHEDMDLIVYNGGWLGQMIARNNWSSEQAAVLMKIGVRADSNHGHQDAGQFQIWYKGMLAGDTGSYASYGHTHWRYYHQATIAHNSLLIYNPNKASTYYVGGQISHTGETGTLSGWTSGSYDTGVVTGYEAGYSDEAKTVAKYAYIAGDIAKAYDSDTVSAVNRRMLAVWDTGNNDVPMFFFVFDSITAKNASYKKTFLLHTVSEPTIDGKTVTVKAGSGKLVLQNIIGGDSITSIGGDGKDYWVNGQQIEPDRNPEDGYWGRVEISPTTQAKNSVILNAAYVCDASKNPDLAATKVTGATVSGAVIGNVAAVFANSPTRQTTAFSFTASASGDLTYYVSGVAAGSWTVSAGNGTQVVTATEDGGLLVFSAPAGKVSLTPSN